MKGNLLFLLLFLLWVACSPQKTDNPLSHPDSSKTVEIDPIIDCNYTFEQAVAGSRAPQSIIDQQVLIDVRYFSFDNKIHHGQLVVNRKIATEIQYLFEFMFEQRFPIQQVIPIVRYDWNDDLSMEANNTSGFCYRNVSYSLHARGLAVDINPMQNPVIWKPGWARTDKPVGAVYNPQAPGTLTAEHPVVLEFRKLRYHWGGNFTAKYDYQHFEKGGYRRPKADTTKTATLDSVAE
ncbi:MAG: M15 family metallopeptidase [Prevotellaceae bacterium]|jgi:hypothetical protein|nr:M15 family metallopeptidase [Prevotellaceae bacterium]